MYLLTLLISIIVVLKILTVQHLKTKLIQIVSQDTFLLMHQEKYSFRRWFFVISMPLYNVRLDMSVINNDLFLITLIVFLFAFKTFTDKSHIEYKQFLLNSKNKKANKFVLLKKR